VAGDLEASDRPMGNSFAQGPVVLRKDLMRQGFSAIQMSIGVLWVSYASH